MTLNGQPAWMSQGGTIFEGDVNLTAGTSTVSVVAKNLATTPATRTQNYQVTEPSGSSKSYGYDDAGNWLATARARSPGMRATSL